VPSLRISVATDPPDLPGIAGMALKGVALGTRLPRPFTSEELLTGRSAGGANLDGRLHSLIAHRSRLALVLGENGGGDRPAPPAMARPYDSITKFAVEGTVEVGATRLFLSSMPPKSASGTGDQIGIARPGEILLLRGIDADGEWWQTAIEVESCEALKASEARADDETTATPTPACFCEDDEIMVVSVRSMQFPSALTQVELRRDFAGFGGRSLLTGVMLPVAWDGDTASITKDGAMVRRDPELRAAAKVFDDWLPKEAQ
jgi:hypothetical protein